MSSANRFSISLHLPVARMQKPEADGILAAGVWLSFRNELLALPLNLHRRTVCGLSRRATAVVLLVTASSACLSQNLLPIRSAAAAAAAAIL